MAYYGGKYDIAVIGAGHAGIEAALAAARLGLEVVCFSTSLDAVGNMPCNPSIGGTAKGQLVREIDALGGEMARAADSCCIQFRMLNRGKGPAVYSPRAQVDRQAYRVYMKKALENQRGLHLKQGEVTGIEVENGAVTAVSLSSGLTFKVGAVIMATGTFLKSMTFTGPLGREAGPDGLLPANGLSGCLEALGIKLRRFKTGTPARLDGRTVDYSKMTLQKGENVPEGFVFGGSAPRSSMPCYMTYTNGRTHDIIRDSLDRSPLFTGVIEGVGPRYCPSIEDKVVRFPEKTRHQLFIEPCGMNTNEVYIQGLSTSLPEDTQIEMIHSIEGLENAEIMRFGYAIEYDCLDPTILTPMLGLKDIKGLYAAGQLCSSSGYEEAAGQGLVAGINAAHYILKRPPFVLSRQDGYIGTLIDDLTTKGTGEPYRMMTSRSEYRLTSRQDNADMRLMKKGRELGLLSQERLEKCLEKYRVAKEEISRLKKTHVPPSEAVNSLLISLGTEGISSGASLFDLLKRPQVTYASLSPIDPGRGEISWDAAEQVEINVKYEGYIKRGLKEIEDSRRLESRLLPEDIDYMAINTIRTEARQKLSKIRPMTLGQASRISGVSPSDIGGLIVWLSSKEGRNV